jgi:hypothetical protein
MIENQSTLKIFGKTAIIIFIVFTLLITIPVFKENYDYLTKFKQAQATVLSIKETIIETDVDFEGYVYTTTKYKIEVEFSVDGQKIKKEIIYDRSTTVGEKIEIRYNPRNPYEVTTESTFTITIKFAIIIFFWIFLAIYSYVFIIFRQRQQEINN